MFCDSFDEKPIKILKILIYMVTTLDFSQGPSPWFGANIWILFLFLLFFISFFWHRKKVWWYVWLKQAFAGCKEVDFR